MERQFEILGEALKSLRDLDPRLAERIGDVQRIIAFRNVLIHGYAVVDDEIGWEAATQRVEPVIRSVTKLLGGRRVGDDT